MHCRMGNRLRMKMRMCILRAMKGGELLRAWRGDRSQEDVGRVLGVHQSTVARLESGDQEPTAGLALEIEKMTDGAVPASSLVRGRSRRRKGKAAS